MADDIHELIEHIFEEARKNDRMACWELGDNLFRQYSTADAVDVILDELEYRKVSGQITYQDQSVVFVLTKSISAYAIPKHAQRIAALCLWDEIAWSEDGSTRSHLLSVLMRIGGVEEIPALQAFAEKVKGVEYGLDEEDGKISDHPRRLKAFELYANNQARVLDVINAIMSRNQ